MLNNLDYNPEQAEWLLAQIGAVTDERTIITASEWAEQKRYLPSSVTPIPGYYSFDVAPYLREIVDCGSIDSPIREVAVRKGVQLCLTVGVLENLVGYAIDHLKSTPIMLMTADAELAKIRIDGYITPMLQHSGLMDLIQSSDESNKRKTGKTDRRIEWVGGGFLVPFGALNADKLRSISIAMLLRDEIDAYPLVVGKDGDPMRLSGDRTAAFEDTRFILDLSTPLIKGSSNIDRRFERGDQRYYYVRCLKCGYPQTLRWTGKNKEGKQFGITWDMENGKLINGSVRYLCENCRAPHINEQKTKLLAPGNAEWRPTAVPVAPDVASYDINGLYSPVGFRSWEQQVLSWLDAWDTQHNRPKDIPALQVFYNNVLGRSFERVGARVTFTAVSAHRRADYRMGEIPNAFAETYAGGHIGVVTMAVDVHKDRLKVATFGWAPGQRAFVIDYWTLLGNAEDLDDPDTWGALQDLIESTIYEDGQGRKYAIALTLIDAGYNQDLVVSFCEQYAAAVFPIIGRDRPAKTQKIDEFRPWTTKMGTRGFVAVVDIYKDRWSLALRKHWDGVSEQPAGHFNAPIDLPDTAIRELTVEQRKAKVDRTTGKEVGYFWFRPNGAANELWDLLNYNNLALDLLAWDLLIENHGDEFVDWGKFWGLCYDEKLFYTESHEVKNNNASADRG